MSSIVVHPSPSKITNGQGFNSKVEIASTDDKSLQLYERESMFLSTFGMNSKIQCKGRAKSAASSLVASEWDLAELWQQRTSEEVPTRLVLARCENLASLITATQTLQQSISYVHQLAPIGFVLEFFDMRDSVEFFSKCTSLSETYPSEDIFRFCCPSIIQEMYNDEELDSGSIVISIRILGGGDSASSLESAIDWVQNHVRSLGPCQISYCSFMDVHTHRIGKFFAEFFDTRALPHVVEQLAELNPPASYEISWKRCELLLNDRQALFTQDTILSSPTASISHRGGHSRCSTASDLDFVGRPLPADVNFLPDFDPRVVLSVPPSSGEFEIDFSKIESELDIRTTCMIRNIPNKYTQIMLIEMINETHYGTYDFIYLRMDFKNKCNVGYAFINFIEPTSIISFARRVLGKRWPRFNSDKICHLSYARIQGKLALVEKFRHSKVMMEPASYRPKVYHSDGKYRGLEESFPY